MKKGNIFWGLFFADVESGFEVSTVDSGVSVRLISLSIGLRVLFLVEEGFLAISHTTNPIIHRNITNDIGNSPILENTVSKDIRRIDWFSYIIFPLNIN